MYQESITKEELDELPLRAFEGEIIMVETRQGSRLAADWLSKEGVLGFDTERKPSFQKGHSSNVALLQLATDEKCFLFRLNKIGMPDELKAILSDPEILKVGVAIHDDIKGLQKIRSFVPGGFIELQKEVKEYGILDCGLKKIAGIVLGFRISKQQRLTNWESDYLTEAQQLYAATDAWVAFQILYSLAIESS